MVTWNQGYALRVWVLLYFAHWRPFIFIIFEAGSVLRWQGFPIFPRSDSDIAVWGRTWNGVGRLRSIHISLINLNGCRRTSVPRGCAVTYIPGGWGGFDSPEVVKTTKKNQKITFTTRSSHQQLERSSAGGAIRTISVLKCSLSPCRPIPFTELAAKLCLKDYITWETYLLAVFWFLSRKQWRFVDTGLKSAKTPQK